MRALRDLGKTVLLTTHYLDEAQALADRVAIVKDGRILAEGPPGELIAGAARYRVSYRRRPTSSSRSSPRTRRRCCTRPPPPRWRAASGSRSSRVSRPSLEDVYLELTAEAREPEPAAA